MNVYEFIYLFRLAFRHEVGLNSWTDIEHIYDVGNVELITIYTATTKDRGELLTLGPDWLWTR